MSTTRIVNGVEYTIPPGTEHVWTPPDQVKVSPAPPDIPAATLIDNVRTHKLVREQNPESIENLVLELEGIWNKFSNKTINSSQLSDELAVFRTSKLSNLNGFDDITVQVFEDVMVKLMSLSSKV